MSHPELEAGICTVPDSDGVPDAKEKPTRCVLCCHLRVGQLKENQMTRKESKLSIHLFTYSLQPLFPLVK